MAVLEKIRVRMGIFISVIIGIALISFIVDANTLSSVTSMFSSQNDVGKINGTKVTYQDFVKKQDYYNQIYSLITGSSSFDEQTQTQIRDEVWQSFFRELALEQQYEKTGIDVSAKELVDLTQGRYISPILQQDPARAFVDETGAFSRTQVLNFIRAIDSDPSGVRAQYWNYMEELMINSQKLEKYMAMLSQSHYMNSLQLNRNLADRNTTADITYVVESLGMPNDSIKIDNAAIRDYYKKHQHNFEQETSRDVDYVAFYVVPSADDIRLAAESMNKIYEDFKEAPANELERFVSRNSDKAFQKYYYNKGELSPVLDSFAFRANVNHTLPVYQEGNTFYTARIINSRMLPDSVNVRRIVLQDQNKEVVNHLADSLITILNATNGALFGLVAAQHSVDPAAKTTGGEIGWIGQGTLLDTCLVIPKNRFVKVENNFNGVYLINIVEVTERQAEKLKVQLAMIEKTAIPGKFTYQDYFAQANDLVTAANNNREQFTAAAMEKGYRVMPAYSVREGQRVIGAMNNAYDLARWIYEAKPNAVSSVLTIDNSIFVVASLVEAREAGIAPLEQVRPRIEATLKMEQQLEQIAQKMKNTSAGATTIADVAGKTNLSLNSASDVSFLNYSIANIGFEPKLSGAVAAAAENTLIGPVKGNTAVYMFEVTARTVGEAYTIEEEKSRDKYVAMQQNFGIFYDVLRRAAKVEDHRGRFF